MLLEAWRPYASRLRAIVHEIAGIWRYAKARDEFQRLPDEMLRDLAIHRSEFDSFFAESERWIAPTRRRIAEAIDRRVGR